MNIEKLHTYLKKEFNIPKFQTIDTINGIQVANSNKNIKKFAIATDSSLPILQAAVQKEVDVVFVHHGLYWGQVHALTGIYYKKIKLLLDAEIALYALHLPLDAHTKLGNNAQLAKKLGLKKCKPFGNISPSVTIGIQGSYDTAVDVKNVVKKLFTLPSKHQQNSGYTAFAKQYGLDAYCINSSNTHLTPLAMALHGKKHIHSIAIVSGTGHKMLEEAKSKKIDLLITGDTSHTAFLQAQELGINIISAGHYFTEIFGPLALGQYIQNILKKENSKNNAIHGIFIDFPSGH